MLINVGESRTTSRTLVLRLCRTELELRIGQLEREAAQEAADRSAALAARDEEIERLRVGAAAKATALEEALARSRRTRRAHYLPLCPPLCVPALPFAPATPSPRTCATTRMPMTDGRLTSLIELAQSQILSYGCMESTLPSTHIRTPSFTPLDVLPPPSAAAQEASWRARLAAREEELLRQADEVRAQLDTLAKVRHCCELM